MSLQQARSFVLLFVALFLSACSDGSALPTEQKAPTGVVTVQIQGDTVALPHGNKDVHLNVCSLDGSFDGGSARRYIAPKDKLTSFILKHFRMRFGETVNWTAAMGLESSYYFVGSIVDTETEVRTFFVQQCAGKGQAISQANLMREAYPEIKFDYDFTLE